MTEELTIERNIALELAIQTVIHDTQIPENLRTALAVYQDERRNLDKRGLGMPPAEQTKPTCPPNMMRSSVTGGSQRFNSRNTRHEDLNCDCTLIAREVKIILWHNDESLDWSVEIDGVVHEHVTSEIMEALVECTLIVAQMSLTRALTQRPQ